MPLFASNRLQQSLMTQSGLDVAVSCCAPANRQKDPLPAGKGRCCLIEDRLRRADFVATLQEIKHRSDRE
jgi:hypothetical protein